MATLDRLGPPPAVATPSATAWRPRRAIAAALTVAAAIALLQVVMSSSFTHTGQKMQHLEAQRDQLQAQIHDTEAEVAALASLDRTERIARDSLGMVPAQGQQYISVDVEAPSGPLLPQPLLQLQPDEKTQTEPWWRSLLKALPLP